MKTGTTIGMTAVGVLGMLAGSAMGQCTTTKLTDHEPQPQDHFGQAVTTAGNLMVIGTPGEDTANTVNGGSIFFYERVNGAWSYTNSWGLVSDDDNWGRSMATDGTLVATGYGGGTFAGGFPSGWGSIWKKVNGAWDQLNMPSLSLAAGDDYGFSCAAGNGRVVFGSPRRDFNAGDDMGGVFAYRVDAQNNAQLVSTIVHPAFSTQAGEHFGYSVAIAPQGGPNAGMLVVGAPDRDNGATASTGGIYVFNQTGQGYQLQNLPSQWDEAFQFNGLAVGTNGSWIASGAPSFGNARGRVFLYEKLANGNWEVAGFISGPEGDGGNFGSSISMSGEWMAIGAPGFDKVYVFHETNGSWALKRVVSRASVGGSSSWGASIALNASDVAIGDPGDTVSGFAGAGAVYVKSLAQFAGGDDADAAQSISLPTSISACSDGATPTSSGLPGMCGLSINAPDLYFTFTAPRSGTVVADTIGSAFDTVLSAHAPLPTWQDSNTLACSDDINGAQNRQSLVTFPVQQGQQYWVRIAGYNGAVGAFDLNVRFDCPADFDSDGTVDFFDYDAFVICFEGGACPPGKTADFDADATVDFFDYDAFVLAFESGC
ncbi:MAG: hypothetical protein AABZ53_16455 [Planctomycetota bacterium]